ncbi:MAG: FAD-dependent oxidoreductase, partial [Burkholderiales bacterium]
MGRGLMADPDLPRKLMEGRAEDIRPCMACLECRTPFQRYRPTSCRVNAALGKEAEYEIAPAQRKKRVVVVGAGPAGMEAARVAAERGHDVVLYEKARTLGGSLPLAALIKGTQIEDLPGLVTYFENQLRKLGVRVELQQTFTPEIALALKPDAIVVATGGHRAIPHIRGIGQRHVLTGDTLERKVTPYLRLFGPRLLGWMTKFWLPVGQQVVILGGRLQGCQLAAFLVKRGRQVSIVEASDQAGEGIPVAMKPRLLEWLAEKGVQILTTTECNEITAGGVIVQSHDGTVRHLLADAVIVALPLEPDAALADALQDVAAEVYRIGDCSESRQILQAIADGARVGHSI